LSPGDVIVATLAGAAETKVRPAVVISSAKYMTEHPDIIVGILTTKIPMPLTQTDYVLRDWTEAGLRAPSCFRVFVLTLPRSNATIIGRLTSHDAAEVQKRIHAAFA
jgi:mRNA-degrading endonuclease toxin of MazEF toxin-antitoxin module